MGRILSDAQTAAYERDGFVCPIPALGAERAAAYLAELDALEAREGPEVWRRVRRRPHLVVTALNRLAREPRILDAVEDVLGPDVLLWAVGRFDKRPHDPSFVSWHQDATYWGLSEPAVTTAWVALTASHRGNGCMRVAPGSHREAQLPHRETVDAANMLSRGQEIAVAVDEADGVDLELRPGEISLHHALVVHGSRANASDQRRVGIALRYVAARVRQTAGSTDSATLVRGVDRYGHFAPEPVPERDFDPVALAFFEESTEAFRRRSDSIAAAARRRGSHATPGDRP